MWIGKDIAEAEVKLIETPSHDLGGRGIAMRIKTKQFDLTAIVLYFPPKTSTPKDMPRYRQTVHKLSQWSSGILKAIPARSTPIIYADVNDGLESMEDDDVVGDYPYGNSTA